MAKNTNGLKTRSMLMPIFDDILPFKFTRPVNKVIFAMSGTRDHIASKSAGISNNNPRRAAVQNLPLRSKRRLEKTTKPITNEAWYLL